MPQLIKKWRCIFCKEEFYSRKNCLKHEGDCLCNPERKTCLSCGFFYGLYKYDRIVREGSLSICNKYESQHRLKRICKGWQSQEPF